VVSLPISLARTPARSRDALRPAPHAAPGYRADIDGLRALAILPVLLFHLGVRGIPGGFVGVDIFFVISGFVITRGLWADLDTGRFSLGGFYERRVRRLLPALGAMLVATTIAAWLSRRAVQLLFPFIRDRTVRDFGGAAAQ
jgi:peptidoglycan/LPS O-acetylase OafA/YrhL